MPLPFLIAGALAIGVGAHIKAKVDNFKETLTLYDKNIKEKCELLQNVPINERTVINAMESVRKEMKNVKDK